uniref:Calcium load-activated calcium channel n=1 Tax=Laticauda laticaudata TaxID=8630 RepID=A0A8C5RVC9_LATLA
LLCPSYRYNSNRQACMTTMFADTVLIVFISVCTALLAEGITWVLVYRTDKYKRLKAEVEKQSKKFLLLFKTNIDKPNIKTSSHLPYIYIQCDLQIVLLPLLSLQLQLHCIRSHIVNQIFLNTLILLLII